MPKIEPVATVSPYLAKSFLLGIEDETDHDAASALVLEDDPILYSNASKVMI
jgi:hypothetical protein